MARVFVGLGANLGYPEQQVSGAVVDLAQLGQLKARARLYGSKAWGPPGQPDYVNTVVELQTALDPYTFLVGLQEIERRAGRQREQDWGPRTLDLDLLLYGQVERESPRLVLPHPGLRERPFVLAPLHDLAPRLPVPPDGVTVAELFRALDTPPGDLWLVHNALLQFGITG